MSTTFTQLLAVRSRLADDIIRFCEAAIAQLDATPYRYEVGGETVAVTVSGTAIDARVYTERREVEAKLSALGACERRGDDEPVPENDHEKQLAELNGDPIDIAGREAIPWSRAVQRARKGHPLIVLGAPGRGKTTLTRYSTVKRLMAVRDALAGHTLLPEDCEPILWTTCTILAGAKVRGKNPADLAIRAAFDALGLSDEADAASPRVRAWLRERLDAGRCPVALDSLDELPEKKRAAFRCRAQRLLHLASPLVLTCRNHDWEQRKSVPWPQVIEVKLAPFTRREQRQYARRFFREEIQRRTSPDRDDGSAAPRRPDLSGSLERELSRNPSLRGMCQSPILLFFTCLLHTSDRWPKELLRRTEIYEQMCRRIFRGEWRGLPKPPCWADGGRSESETVSWLAEIALALFRAAPEAKEFSLSAWKAAGRSENAMRVASEIHPRGRQSKTDHQNAVLKHAGKLFDELVECGLFIPVPTRDGLHYVWPHRSFLAYFAGKALATRPREAWLKEVIDHLWFQAPWEDVLLFLAGHLNEADMDSLLEEIEKQPDDIFRQRLCWQWRLVGEGKAISRRWGKMWEDAPVNLALGDEGFCAGSRQRDDLLETICGIGTIVPSAFRKLNRMLDDTREKGRNTRASILDACLPYFGKWAADVLLRVFNDKQNDRHLRGFAASGLAGIGRERALRALLPYLDPKREPDAWVRGSVAMALGRVGDDRAVAQLSATLCGDNEPDDWVRADAAAALGQIGTQEALETLLIAFDVNRESDLNATSYVAFALSEFEDRRVLAALLRRFYDKTGSHGVLRGHIAFVLGRFVDERAVEALLESLDVSKESGTSVRARAAAALATTGGERVVDALMRSLNDDHAAYSGARIAIVDALGSTGGEKEYLQLKKYLDKEREPDPCVRAAVAQALGRIGGKAAKHILSRRLSPMIEPSPQVRQKVAYALGFIIGRRSFRTLLKGIEADQEPDESVRETVAQALGRIAGRAVQRALIRHLTPSFESSRKVRKRVAESLGIVGDRHTLFAMKGSLSPAREPDREVRSSVGDALLKLSWRMSSRSAFILR